MSMGDKFNFCRCCAALVHYTDLDQTGLCKWCIEEEKEAKTLTEKGTVGI